MPKKTLASRRCGPRAVLGSALLIYFVVLPYLHYRFKRYQHNNALLGSAEARFTATAGHFYAVYGILFASNAGHRAGLRSDRISR